MHMSTLTLRQSTEAEHAKWREREKRYLENWEEMTCKPQEVQESILRRILTKNGGTEYLREYGLGGADDINQAFRDRLPASTYESYRPFIERMFNGDKSPMLTVDAVLEILTSSGTSGGMPNLFPQVEEDQEIRVRVLGLVNPIINRDMPELQKGKAITLNFMRDSKLSPGGLPIHPGSTSFMKSSAYRNREPDLSLKVTSPEAVFRCVDNEAAMYCHILLGLLQREDVFRLRFPFPVLLLKVVRHLQEWCLELCEDIAGATLSPRVSSESVRAAVTPMLRKDAELAGLIRREFLSNGKSGLDGVIGRLWPNLRVVDTICSGTFKTYVPAVVNLCGNVPLISTHIYGATEGLFGLNMNPTCVKQISYTLAPFVAYYEFREVGDEAPKGGGRRGPVQQAPSYYEKDILPLTGVRQGREYELIITTFSGLYRYRMGDVLRAVGYYNASPTFEFVRRQNVVLTAGLEQTFEDELRIAVGLAAEQLQKEARLTLAEFTSTVDFTSNPGHYVIYWELEPSTQTTSQLLLERCCFVMESSLNYFYREGRSDNIIGALELRLVHEGTFHLISKDAHSRGASFSSYKTPKSFDSNKPFFTKILNGRVFQVAFSQEKPSTGDYCPNLSDVKASLDKEVTANKKTFHSKMF